MNSFFSLASWHFGCTSINTTYNSCLDFEREYTPLASMAEDLPVSKWNEWRPGRTEHNLCTVKVGWVFGCRPPALDVLSKVFWFKENHSKECGQNMQILAKPKPFTVDFSEAFHVSFSSSFASKTAVSGFEMRREEPLGHELQRSHVVTNWFKGIETKAIDAQEFGPEGGASSTASGWLKMNIRWFSWEKLQTADGRVQVWKTRKSHIRSLEPSGSTWQLVRKRQSKRRKKWFSRW